MSDAPFPRAIPPIVCLTGIDGCGKSTQLERLAGRLQAERGVRAGILTVWTISGNRRYQNHPFISDRRAIHQYLASLHGGARMLFIAHALLESLDLLADEKVDLVLADGYWYKYLCSERLHGLPEAWLMKTVSCLPVPRLTILFDLAPERSWARKPGVTPYECGMAEPGESSFVAFQTRLRTELVALGTGRSWPVVDAGRTQDGVAAELWDLVRRV